MSGWNIVHCDTHTEKESDIERERERLREAIVVDANKKKDNWQNETKSVKSQFNVSVVCNEKKADFDLN